MLATDFPASLSDCRKSASWAWPLAWISRAPALSCDGLQPLALELAQIEGHRMRAAGEPHQVGCGQDDGVVAPLHVAGPSRLPPLYTHCQVTNTVTPGVQAVGIRRAARMETDLEALLEAQGLAARLGPRQRIDRRIVSAISPQRLRDIVHAWRRSDFPSLP